MYATDVCALEIYHRMQHIEINFYIRYIMSRHPYSTPAAFSWWCRSNCKKRLGLLNFTWGSWKLCVGSPTVSNFSKLVSTPGQSHLCVLHFNQLKYALHMSSRLFFRLWRLTNIHMEGCNVIFVILVILMYIPLFYSIYTVN